MTYIRKLLFICCSVLFSGSVYAECFDTPAELKAQDIVEMRCISQEKNLTLNLYTTVRGDVYITVFQIPTPSCDMRHNATTAPSKKFNEKVIRLTSLCGEYSDAKTYTYRYDVPTTKAGFNYIKKQLLKNKPLVVTSPNKDNPFKATFDTHKYREMILDAFNANDGIHGGI